MEKIKRLFEVRNWFDVVLHIGIIGLVFFIMVFGFFYFYLPRVSRHGQSIVVPNVKGMKKAELEAFFDKHKLRFEISDSVYNSSIPALSVVEQFPAKGTRVKEGRKVYLTINSKNPPMISMPKLLNRSLLNAQDEMESHGLKLGEVTYVPDIQKNAVIKQKYLGKEIEPNTKVPKGSMIDLVVGDGLGNQEFEAPDLFGKPIDECKALLEAVQLQLGAITTEKNTGYPNSLVFKQRPEAGKRIKVGEVIDIWVSGDAQDEPLEIE